MWPARGAALVALAAVLLIPTAAAAQAAPLPAVVAAPKPSPSPSAGAGGGTTANDGASGGRVTFGMTTASGGTADTRGFVSVNAPAGAVLYDHVAVVNFSNAPLDVDLYSADVSNADDGSLDVAGRTDKKQLAGGWVSVGRPSVSLAAQSTAHGPGLSVVPITIKIPKNAEPGDHLAAVLSSVTAVGKAGDNTPAVNLENRVGVRVYVTVQGKIRPGLTINGVHVHFAAGGAFGSGKLEVTYTLTNSGNVRYGVAPSVRATGPFGLAPHSGDGKKIDELLPHSAVTQTVTIPGVLPLLLENVSVSAAAVAAPMGAGDPGLGTVTASSWTWLWSWLVLLVVVALLAVAGSLVLRRRRRRPGVWGPPEGLWGQAAGATSGGPGAPTATPAPASPGGGAGGAGEPAPEGGPHDPSPEPVR